MDIIWRHGHDLLVEGQLQIEQALRKFLSTLPTEHGYWHEHLTRNGIAWQALALSTRMNQDTFVFCEPRLK